MKLSILKIIINQLSRSGTRTWAQGLLADAHCMEQRVDGLRTIQSREVIHYPALHYNTLIRFLYRTLPGNVIYLICTAIHTKKSTCPKIYYVYGTQNNIQFICKSSRFLCNILKIKMYITIILSLVLHGCEIWSQTLREEHMLSVFEKSILRRIFGHKTYWIGEWRMLHNEQLHSLYCSPKIATVIKSRRLR